jgi:hypothetical protein
MGDKISVFMLKSSPLNACDRLTAALTFVKNLTVVTLCASLDPVFWVAEVARKSKGARRRMARWFICKRDGN